MKKSGSLDELGYKGPPPAMSSNSFSLKITLQIDINVLKSTVTMKTVKKQRIFRN